MTLALALALALVALTFMLVLALWYVNNSQVGGGGGGGLSGNAPFSLIGDSIGSGINVSYADVINAPDPTKQQFNPSKGPTYYGHSIPLAFEDHLPGPLWGEPNSPHHLNAKCSPKCCPSPYSCDHGCLCVDQKGMRDAAKKLIKIPQST